MRRSDEVLIFWFGRLPGPELSILDTLALASRVPWWGGSRWIRQYLDGEEIIRSRFGLDVRQALDAKLDHWSETARGVLALIIILDRFAHAIYRGTPRAFEPDTKALSLVREAVQRGLDRQLHPLARAVLYHPLIHAESIELQDSGLRLISEATAEAPLAAARFLLQIELQRARRHRNIIARFGRFPQRNVVLGRESTPQERRFLARGRSIL